MGSLRDKIRQVNDLPEKTIHIDEWDTDILILGMTAKERSVFGDRAQAYKDGKTTDADLAAEYAILCARDPETRQLIFEPTDRAWLVDKSNAAIQAIGLEWMRLSGILPGEVKVAEKNSEATPSDSSSSN